MMWPPSTEEQERQYRVLFRASQPPTTRARQRQHGVAITSRSGGNNSTSSGLALAAAPAPPPLSQCNPHLDLYPVVSLHGKGEAIRANFGARPFRFDVKGWRRQKRRRERAGEEKGAVVGAVHALVRDYLWVRGFAKTLRRFEAAGGPQGEEEEDRGLPALVRKRRRVAGAEEGLEERVSVRRLVMAGGGEEAALARLAPNGGVLGLELRCLACAALVRQGKVDEALAYAQRWLAPYALSCGGAAGGEEDAMDVDGGDAGKEEVEGEAAAGVGVRLREVMGLLAYAGESAEGRKSGGGGNMSVLGGGQVY